MVSWYETAVHLAAAATLLFSAIYGPLFLSKRLPQGLQLGMGVAGLILLGSVGFALLNGHWPLSR